MTKPRKRTLILSLVALMLSTIIGFWLYLPVYIEKRILPDLCENAGVELLSGKVERFGLTEAEFRNLSFQIDDSRTLSFDAINLEYSFLALIRKKIDVLTLNNLTLEVDRKKNQIKINGLLLPDHRTLYSSLNYPNRDILKQKIPVSIERLVIRESKAMIYFANRTWTAPFNLDLYNIDLNRGEIAGSGSLNINGDRISLAAKLVHNLKKLDLSITGKPIQLENLTKYFGDYLPVHATGTAEVQCKFSILPELNLLQDLNFLVRLNKARLKMGDYIITNQVNELNGQQPLKLHVTGGRVVPWEFTATAAQLVSPVQMRIDEIKGSITETNKNNRIDVMVRTQLEKIFPGNPHPPHEIVFEMAKPAAINWHITAEHSKKRGLRWSINQHRYTTDPGLKIKGLLYGRPLSAELATINFKGQVLKTGLNTHSNIRFKNIAFLIPGGNFECFDTHTDLAMNFDFSNETPKIKASGDTSIKTVHLDADGIKTSYKGIRLNYGIDNHASDPRLLNTKAGIRGAWIKINKDKRLQLGKIDINLPFQLSNRTNRHSGYIKIPSISWNKKYIGSLDGRLLQKENNIVFNGGYSKNNRRQAPPLTVAGIMNIDGFQTMWRKSHHKPSDAPQSPGFKFKIAGIHIVGSFSDDYLSGKVEGVFSKK